MLALQISPRSASEQARFVEVVERSHLPESRKSFLLERIEGDQEAALGVRQALEQWFTADSPELRGALDDVLDDIWSQLDGRGSEIAQDASYSVDSIVGALAGDSNAERLAEHLGSHGAEEAVSGYCRQVASLWLFGGDEEEEEDPVKYPAVLDAS